MTGPRRLGAPSPVRVRAGDGGRPLDVAGRAVEAVRESWLVGGRGGADRPLRRRYWGGVAAGGRGLVGFRGLEGGRWVLQRGWFGTGPGRARTTSPAGGG